MVRWASDWADLSNPDGAASVVATLVGLQGGLFGGENNLDLAQWNLLERFPGADLIEVTTYRDKSTELLTKCQPTILRHGRSRGPTAVTETDWSPTNVVTGWRATRRPKQRSSNDCSS